MITSVSVASEYFSEGCCERKWLGAGLVAG